jgi:hypothetical protein
MSADPENLQPGNRQPATPTPRPILFRTLTILWIFPSLGAVWILFRETSWWHSDGVIAAALAVRVEQWVAVVLLLLHGCFAWCWWRSR